MPLVDDETRHTDRKTRAVWPWVLVAAAFAGLWMLAAVGLSFIPRAMRNGSDVPATPLPSPAVAALRASAGAGDWKQALAVTLTTAPDPLEFNEQHAYYVLGERAYRKRGAPKQAAAFQRRYAQWKAQIRSAQCLPCHTGPTPPRSIGRTASGPR